MATKSMQSTVEQLNAAQVAINNTLADPEIQTLVAQYGYPAAKLNEGKVLYQAAVAAVNAHTAPAGTHTPRYAVVIGWVLRGLGVLLALLCVVALGLHFFGAR